MARSTRYTVVQHSAFIGRGDEQFIRGLESAAIRTLKDESRIAEAGGLVFDLYTSAEAYVESEPYPRGYGGMIPQAPGSFTDRVLINGLPIYVPVRCEWDQLMIGVREIQVSGETHRLCKGCREAVSFAHTQAILSAVPE
jgi:hypothetical protein